METQDIPVSNHYYLHPSESPSLILVNSVSPSIAQSIVWIDITDEVWNDLCERFSQGDSFRISYLQEDVYNLK
jgi:hypothetical protein